MKGESLQKRLELGGVESGRTGWSFFSDQNIKRILLSKDARLPARLAHLNGASVNQPRRPNDGLGMEVIGCRELPGEPGTFCAYVGAVTKGGQLETLGEVKVGDEILEWNGTVLRGKTSEEVARVVANSTGEIEVLIRSGAGLHIGHHVYNQQQLMQQQQMHQQNPYDRPATTRHVQYSQPQSSQYSQQPTQSQYDRQPAQSQYNQQPTQSQYSQQPASSQYDRTPASSQYDRTPATSQYERTPVPSRFESSQPAQTQSQHDRQMQSMEQTRDGQATSGRRDRAYAEDEVPVRDPGWAAPPVPPHRSLPSFLLKPIKVICCSSRGRASSPSRSTRQPASAQTQPVSTCPDGSCAQLAHPPTQKEALWLSHGDCPLGALSHSSRTVETPFPVAARGEWHLGANRCSSGRRPPSRSGRLRDST